MVAYRHRRNDTNEIFYIGIGKIKSRPYSKINRNKHWHNVVNKAGYTIEVIYECDSWEDICELEMFLIQEYGRKDLKLGSLVNLTDGGDGVLGLTGNIGHTGHKHSEATKELLRQKNIGRPAPNKGVPMSLELRAHLSKVRKGMKFPNRKSRSQEDIEHHRQKIKGGNNVNAKIVLNTETGIYYDCVNDAAIAHDLNHRTLIVYL